jgi:hypothetical protein
MEAVCAGGEGMRVGGNNLADGEDGGVEGEEPLTTCATRAVGQIGAPR